MTAEDVFRVLLEERSDIGLATVYRVLTQFEQAGILSRSNFESRQGDRTNSTKASTTTTWSALDCGRVEEFFDPEIEKRQQMVAKIASGFILQEHALSLYGQLQQDRLPAPRQIQELNGFSVKMPPSSPETPRNRLFWAAVVAPTGGNAEGSAGGGPTYSPRDMAARCRATNSW